MKTVFVKILPILISALLFSACASTVGYFKSIEGFDDNANNKLKQFIENSVNEKGRKIAVFDGDGTVLGQVPHYLADECMYIYAKEHPEKHPEILKTPQKKSNRFTE